jgi:DNA-binding winged helix-turn-helix (wHTH) protein
VPRYHFDEFVLSPRRRLLLRGGTEQPLIPRYFDLLVFLVEHRHEAVHRRDIFDRVWSDSIVSDSALSQAIRTIRRVLDDDPRDPRFIRTVSRHGYRFVFAEVVEEEEDDGSPTTPSPGPVPVAAVELQLETSPSLARRVAEGSMRASAGAALAGTAAGAVGGLLLAAAPGSTAPAAIVPVLAVVAAICGGLGGAGVGAGLMLAESAAPSHRTVALTAGGALGGGLVGTAVQWLTRWALSALVGLQLDIGGGFEGVLIGGCAGLGLAIATRHEEDGLAVRGRTRLHAALVVAVTCGLAGLALTLAGRPLAGGTIHAIADAAEGSRATLAPLGRLIGEPGFGPTSRTILAIGECALFGLGLTYGLVRRPRKTQ